MADENYVNYPVGDCHILVPPSYAQQKEPEIRTGERKGRQEKGSWGIVPASVPWNHPEAIERHALAQMEAATEVFTNLAVLRSTNVLSPFEAVSIRGAGAQDSHLKPEAPTGPINNAHRAPRLLTVRGLALPKACWRFSREFQEQLWIPFKATDPLPKAANFADWLFEFKGGAEAFVRVAKEVLFEQRQGKAVNCSLVQHAAGLVKREFGWALERAIEDLKSKQEKAYYDILRERRPGQPLNRLAERIKVMEANKGKPSECHVEVGEYLKRAWKANREGAASFWSNPQVIGTQENLLHHLAIRGPHPAARACVGVSKVGSARNTAINQLDEEALKRLLS